jgi:hypothetical protein
MPNFVRATTYSGAAPSNTVVYTDAGEIFAAGNVQTDGTVLAPTVISNTVKAATIGNASAVLTGASATLTGTVIAATVNAATIGNSGASLTGTISTASQPNITTLAGVTSIGAVGVITAVVGNLTVGGNFTVSGNSVSIGASTLSIVDPIISLNTPADLSPLTTTTTADIGLKIHYYSGSDRHAFLGRAQDTGYLEWYSDGNDTGNVFTGTAYGTIKAGAMLLANTGTGLTVSDTIVAKTLNAGTIGNTSATHVGASATLTGTVIAATINAATIGNTSANIVGTIGTASQTNITAVGSLGSTQISSLGVGTAASGTSGEIRATNNITAYYSSDEQFKENIRPVPDALSIVTAIGSDLFDWTDAYIAEHGGEDGYFVQKSDFGVIAQKVQRVFPQAVRTRPDGSLAVDYEKLATLSFGAIEQLLARIEALEAKQA